MKKAQQVCALVCVHVVCANPTHLPLFMCVIHTCAVDLMLDKRTNVALSIRYEILISKPKTSDMKNLSIFSMNKINDHFQNRPIRLFKKVLVTDSR